MPGYPGAYNASITTKANCGGNKKAGLAPSIGVPINILNSKLYSASPPNCCSTNQLCYYIPGTKIIQMGGNKIWGGINSHPVQNTRALFNM